MGFMASKESRDQQARIEASPLYPEIQQRNRALNQMRGQEGTPEYLRLEQELFDLQDQAAGIGDPQMPAPQDPMQGGIGGLLDTVGQMKQMPQPPTQNRGPVLGQGPGKGRRPIFEGGPLPLPTPTQNRGMGDIQISPIERGPDPRLMGNMSFEEFFALPVEERLRISQEGRKAIENEAIDSQLKMPPQMPDMMQQLQEALRQKQMGGARPRPMPTPRGGRGDLGGIIGRLQQQMEQRREAPPMQQRRRPRGGLFSQLSRSIPQDRREQRIFAGLADKIPQDQRVKPMGGSLLTKGRGRPDMEEIRRQVMQGINVRGIGM